MRRIRIILALIVLAGAAAFALYRHWPGTGLPVAREKGPVRKESRRLFPVAHEGRWGFIDETGRLVIEPTYAAANEFREGYAAVQAGDKWGYIDDSGKMVIPAKFEGADTFHEGLARVVYDREISEFSGFIDATGKLVINTEDAEYAGAFSEGLASLQLHGKFGFIDRTGKTVIPGQFDVAADFAEGMAKVGFRSADAFTWGFIDKTGKIVIPAQYDDAGDFSEGLAAVKTGENYGFINKWGIFEILPQYDYAGDFKEGLAPVHLVKFGFIDRTGNMVIPMQFELAYSFAEGLAAVALDEGAGAFTGFINKTGKFVVEPHYDSAGTFSGGVALVQQNGLMGYVNRTGKLLWTPCDSCNLPR